MHSKNLVANIRKHSAKTAKKVAACAVKKDKKITSSAEPSHQGKGAGVASHLVMLDFKCILVLNNDQ